MTPANPMRRCTGVAAAPGLGMGEAHYLGGRVEVQQRRILVEEVEEELKRFEQAAKLAEALRNIAQYYNFAPDPRVMAWVQLLSVAAVIYGPRIVMVAQHSKAQRAQQSRGAVPPNMSVVTPAPPPKNSVPGAFDAPPPPAGVYKFQ